MKGQPAALNVFLVYALFYMYSNFDSNFDLYILKIFLCFNGKEYNWLSG